MRIVFIHPNFPAQFRHQAAALGRNQGNRVVFVTQNERPEWVIPGVHKLVCPKAEEGSEDDHSPRGGLDKTLKNGGLVLKALLGLRRKGFVPDLVVGHSGWGTTLYVKEAFPDVPFMGYFEWFYDPGGHDARFDPSEPLTIAGAANLRVKNFPILTDLAGCSHGTTPTRWQKQQFPREFHPKLSVVHDGVDISYFTPGNGESLGLPGVDLSGVGEIVTYATRGMEPYRGFPQFMEAAAIILQKRPSCHVVVAGSDRVCYGKKLPGGATYKQQALESFQGDRERLHFAGSLPYGQYKSLLQASSVHVYLTRPFVLSWSLLEAMSCGCLVVASNTPPVQEVIRDGRNGLLVDFFSSEEIASRVVDALEHQQELAPLRKNARAHMVDHYDLRKLLPIQLKLMAEVVRRSR